MFQWNQGGIFDTSDPAALEVKDRQAHQFGKEQQVVRHRNRPTPETARALWGPPEFSTAIALYTAVADAISNMAHPVGNPQAEIAGYSGRITVFTAPSS